MWNAADVPIRTDVSQPFGVPVRLPDSADKDAKRPWNRAILPVAASQQLVVQSGVDRSSMGLDGGKIQLTGQILTKPDITG